MSDWRQRLTRSLHQTRSEPESRYFQLATVDANGLPQVRTVVYRGIDPETGAITVISDSRTPKIKELAGNLHAAICWYFAKSREQYRLNVTAHVVTVDEDENRCQLAWESLSLAARQQFLWGEPKSKRHDCHHGLEVKDGSVDMLPRHFCLILLKPNQVDYLNLRGNPQYRELHALTASGHWNWQAVIP